MGGIRMAEPSEYERVLAKAKADADAAASTIQARLVTPRERLTAMAQSFVERMREASETIRYAGAKGFSFYSHNMQQRRYVFERVAFGEVIFEVLDREMDAPYAPLARYVSLQIREPFRGADDRKHLRIERPSWDYRPEGMRRTANYLNAETPDAFAVLIPRMRNYEFQISLRARLGEDLSLDRIKQLQTAHEGSRRAEEDCAAFMDSQADDAIDFCRKVLEAALESMERCAERSSKYLEALPSAPTPPVRRTSTGIWIALAVLIGVVGLVAMCST